MIADYFYLDSDGETVCGPFTASELRDLWVKKPLRSETLCCKEGNTDWKPISALVRDLYSSQQAKASSVITPPAKSAQISDNEGLKATLAVVAVVAIMAIIGLAAWGYTSWDESRQAALVERRQTEDEEVMYLAAQHAVSDRLRSPGSARFSSWREVKRGIIGNTYADFGGWVDSQNGFGALLRSDWYVFMRKTGDKWEPTSVRVEERK